ncbi:GMC oxidoreductase [Sphingobium olei]|uniref:GMC oxidoreductase n=1 Tax=Sphingobium olei TaxID=420955 RepID=A0ABW3P506_9SPHN
MLIDGIAGLKDQRGRIVIVGSGPVGLGLAVDLARRDIPVMLLESGESNANPVVQQLSDAELTDARRHDKMAVAVARRLGGTSNLWGARCLPFDPVDFAPRDFVDARWPIRYTDLAPYWDRAIRSTAAGANHFDTSPILSQDADDGFTADRLERWANVQAAQNVHADAIRSMPALEVRTRCTVTDLKTAGGRVERLTVAHSITGETVDIDVDTVVLAAGGIETTRLLLAAQKVNPGLFGGPDGPLGRHYMGHLIGEIADVTFSSSDIGRAFDFHVDDYGSYVRRRLVASDRTQIENRLLNCAFWPVVAPVADPRHRSAILSMVYLALSVGPLGRLIVAEAIRRRHALDKPQRIAAHVRNLIVGAPSAAAFAAQFFWRRYFRPERLPGFFVQNAANRYGLFYHSEQAPHPDSRVVLTDQVDRLGLPKLKIDLRFTDQDVDSVVCTHDLLDQWMRKVGMGVLHYRMPLEERAAAVMEQAAHGTHQVGLARMADDRTQGVVDGDLACFDLPNLFLATTAVLPTSGQANPTLTAVALALRLGDRLAQRMTSKPEVHTPMSKVASL